MQMDYRDLIAYRATALGKKPEDVAKWMGKRSKSYFYRITKGPQEPTIDEVNRLAAELELSVEALLLAMGARFNPPAATTLPTDLVGIALQLDPARLHALIESARGLLLLQQQSEAQGRTRRATAPVPPRPSAAPRLPPGPP